MAAGSPDSLCKNGKNTADRIVCHAGKASLPHLNRKHGMLSMPCKMDNLFSSKSYASPIPESDRETNDLQHKNVEFSVPLARMYAFDVLEASELGNLTIKTKEKGKRRRKRKGPAAKFKGLFEASSSQSGNSTPSSPLSPFTTITQNQKWKLSPDVEQSMGARNLFAHVADESRKKDRASVSCAETKAQESELAGGNSNLILSPLEHNPAGRKHGGALLLPSSSFPSANGATPCAFFHSPLLASTSRIPLHDRAPGSKHSSPVKAEEMAKPEDKYAYDIWGNHFSGLHLESSSDDFAPLVRRPAENNSNSFFVGGPQILTAASGSKSVLSFHGEG